MLNRGESGTMVFEPAGLRIAPGDTVKFIATDRGHNAETVPGMDFACPSARNGSLWPPRFCPTLPIQSSPIPI
jgi:plastocyanin